MKTIINDLKMHKINILFILFWILVIIGAIGYISDDLKRTETNKELIQTNHRHILQLDSTHEIILKNDSIILEKLNEISKKN